MMGLVDFVRESNLIEGIRREPTDAEVRASERFLALAAPTAGPLGDLQAVYAPNRPLRERAGMDVCVGGYIAPDGGPNIVSALNRILRAAREGMLPWHVHVKFELLHPYMDGNGRTGRMLWAWCMQNQGQDPFSLPFLHRFYYQTLSVQR